MTPTSQTRQDQIDTVAQLLHAHRHRIGRNSTCGACRAAAEKMTDAQRVAELEKGSPYRPS